MSRVPEETPGVSLIDMRWEEHWADVEFASSGFEMEELRRLLVPAGAWCDYWPSNEWEEGVMLHVQVVSEGGHCIP